MQNKEINSISFSQEEICSTIEDSIRNPRLIELSLYNDTKFWKKQLKVLFEICNGNGFTAAIQQVEVILDYKQEDFFRKFINYIYNLRNTTQEKRCKFADEIEKKANDNSGYVLFGMIDRLDNISKQTIFANLTRARLDEFITIEEFFRLYSLLERIPYVDLTSLSKYTIDYYDESGDTELLYATGALIQTSIDVNRNSKYRLSFLGEELLKWGIRIPLDINHKHGTEIELNIATENEVRSIVKNNG